MTTSATPASRLRRRSRPRPEHDGDDDRGHEQPDRAGRALGADRRGGGHGERERRAAARRLQEQRDERRDQDEQHRLRELLDPAPQRVAVEERRAGGNRGRERAQRVGAYDGSDEGVQPEGDHRGQEAEVGLPEPGRVRAQELVADAERHQRPHRVTRAQAGPERPLIRRWREPRHVVAVIEIPVEHRQIGGGVVELDVARRRCAARARARERRMRGRPRPRHRSPSPSKRSRLNGHESAYPTAASTTTSGVARKAVDSKSGGNSDATMITATPAGRSSGSPSVVPLARSSRRPHPRASSARTSGKTSQAVSTEPRQLTGTILPVFMAVSPRRERDRRLRPVAGRPSRPGAQRRARRRATLRDRLHSCCEPRADIGRRMSGEGPTCAALAPPRGRDDSKCDPDCPFIPEDARSGTFPTRWSCGRFED